MSLTSIIALSTICAILLSLIIVEIVNQVAWCFSENAIALLHIIHILFAIFIPLAIILISCFNLNFGLANIKFAKSNIDKYEKKIEMTADEDEISIYKKKITKQEEIIFRYRESFKLPIPEEKR